MQLGAPACRCCCCTVQAAAFKDKWQRSHAEMQNLIARQAREKETLQTYAVQVGRRWRHARASSSSST